jgi:hypothetical protein
MRSFLLLRSVDANYFTTTLHKESIQRSTGELASYQQKMFRIDDHVGIAIAGLTSDARVLRCLLSFTVYNMHSDLTAATLCDSKQWENV